MRDFWIKCACILLLKFFLVPAALSNTLTVSEDGKVIAETDRYVARFEKGVLTDFHNKLTQETYTQGEIDASTRLKVGRNLTTNDITPEIKKLTPLECELIYSDTWSAPHDNIVMLHLFIGIDVETGDLLILQKGFSVTGGIERITWGFSNLSEAAVDIIAPVTGGQILTQPDRYHYPNKWETPLAILQGQSGGVFVHSDDTQFRFKTLEYESKGGDDFALNFWEVPHAPFEAVKQITTATWRLNTYQGNWQVPALAYRQWIHEALKPADRSQMPAWVHDIDLIIFHSVIDVGILPKLNQLINAEKTLIHVHQWRYGGHDQDLPNYAPDAVKPEFRVFVEEAHRYGFKVMAHVNMLGVSPYHPLYTVFEKYQVREPGTGHKMGWYWDHPPTDPDRHAFINPASGTFRKLIIETFKGVRDTYKVDAFHLDISGLIINDNNGLIDGLTMAGGNILLHQALRAAMPNIVLGGEGLNEVTFLNESFAQRFQIPSTAQPHPISTFLFSPYTKSYGRYIPNPDHHPEAYQEYLHEYEVWDIVQTIRIYDVSDLEPGRVGTHRLLELARERQNWRFGDVNGDGVVNIQDLVIVANALGEAEPDLNGDGVVNIQDLVIVANAFGN